MVKFSPGGGACNVSNTEDILTPYGGVVALGHYLKASGILERLAADYPLKRTSPNATPALDVLLAFTLNCLSGGKRFSHGRRLQDDRAVAEILGLKKGRLCGEDAFRRLTEKLTKEQVQEWFAGAESMLYQAIPASAVADWDSTVVVRYGEQEDATRGYNPVKPGRPSHHPQMCVIAGTRLAPFMEWRKGNTVSATGWVESMEKLWADPTIRERVKINRGDKGYGQEKIMAWHETEESPRPDYVFKLKLTQNVKRAISAIEWPAWEGRATEGFEQVAETEVQLTGWSAKRRIIVTRSLKPLNPSPQECFWDQGEESFHVYVTSLSSEVAAPFQIASFYRQRADSENVFDELKNQWGFAGFSSRKAVTSESAARLQLIVYNLWTLFVRVLKSENKHTEAITSRYELLLIPAKLTTSARTRTLKLAAGEKLCRFLKQAYSRLLSWLSSTAPQLDDNTVASTGWRLFLPRSAST